LNIPNLVLLATDINLSKGYLSVMRELELLPERVLYIDFKSKSICKRESLILKGLKQLIESPLTTIKKTKAHIVKSLKSRKFDSSDSQFETNINIQKIILKWIHNSGLPQINYSKSTKDLLEEMCIPYTTLKVDSINSPYLVNYLKNEITQKYALFVNGGILRKPVLNTGKHFIHIHPGLVPFVRGSSCHLWSALIHKKLGVSCFFMNEGIDTGEVILSKEYDLPKIQISNNLLFSNLRICHHYLEEYLDPIYRSDLLRQLLMKEFNPSNWEAIPQNITDGTLYYHPHSIIQDKATRLFF